VIKTLSIVSIMVRDLDEALDFYVGKLGFVKIADMPMGEGARWVTIAPAEQQGGLTINLFHPNMLWNGPDAEEMLSRVGQNPGWVYNTDDCQKTYEELSAKGVTFRSPPTEQMYGVEAVCEDLYGNTISIVQPSAWAMEMQDAAQDEAEQTAEQAASDAVEQPA